ncbi:MAG: TetR/AcrR family transcriptional regulator [Candidatus Cloacimonetes bacterium]|nr:TetR/AcrR family transcriptional regulator [Candidatus Cloacimonadota bacterium]
MKGEDTKTKIIVTAMQLAFSNGYDYVSMKMIADAVNISKAGLYHHFTNKKDLFKQAIDYFLQSMADASREKFGKVTSIEEFLRVFFLNFRQIRREFEKRFFSGKEKPVYTFLEILTSASRADVSIKHHMAGAYSMTRENITRLLRLGVEQGEIRDDLDLDIVAIAVVALFEGLSLQCLFDMEMDTEMLSGRIFDNLWKMLTS